MGRLEGLFVGRHSNTNARSVFCATACQGTKRDEGILSPVEWNGPGIRDLKKVSRESLARKSRDEFDT
jgi:hypothetical protein